MKRYTITAALPYTNGPIHIGHLSGVYIPADIYARYLRLCGKIFLFVEVTNMVLLFQLKHPRKNNSKSIIDKYDKIIRKSFKVLESPLIIT